MKYIIAILIIVLGYFALFPSMLVVGGQRGGPLSGEPMYGEESRCFGVSFTYIATSPDEGGNTRCYGIPFGKVCYMESIDLSTNLKSRASTQCHV